MKTKKDFFITKDNFLDIDLINDIDKYVNDSHKEPIWKTSYWWQKNIRRVTPPVAILTLPDKFHIPIVEKLKKLKKYHGKVMNHLFNHNITYILLVDISHGMMTLNINGLLLFV